MPASELQKPGFTRFSEAQDGAGSIDPSIFRLSKNDSFFGKPSWHVKTVFVAPRTAKREMSGAGVN